MRSHGAVIEPEQALAWLSELSESFWTKVTKTETCWTWDGHINNYGYGMVDRQLNGKRIRRPAHCVAYELTFGLIPDGKEIDHRCHNDDESCVGGRGCLHRRCVNPSHMEPATVRENLMRGNTLAAANAAKTHCKHGHPFDLLNTKFDKDGHRSCRACARSRAGRAQSKPWRTRKSNTVERSPYQRNPQPQMPRPRALQTHCKRGHPLDETNLYHRRNGKRACRACRRMHAALYKSRRRARAKAVVADA